MEFKTSQGGETTLTFDFQETLQLDNVAKRAGMTNKAIEQLMLRTKQANPLAGFTELISLAFAGGQTAGVAPAKKQKIDSQPDAVTRLEQEIRRRLTTANSSVGATSQMQ